MDNETRLKCPYCGTEQLSWYARTIEHGRAFKTQHGRILRTESTAPDSDRDYDTIDCTRCTNELQLGDLIPSDEDVEQTSEPTGADPDGTGDVAHPDGERVSADDQEIQQDAPTGADPDGSVDVAHPDAELVSVDRQHVSTFTVSVDFRPDGNATYDGLVTALAETDRLERVGENTFQVTTGVRSPNHDEAYRRTVNYVQAVLQLNAMPIEVLDGTVY